MINPKKIRMSGFGKGIKTLPTPTTISDGTTTISLPSITGMPTGFPTTIPAVFNVNNDLVYFSEAKKIKKKKQHIHSPDEYGFCKTKTCKKYVPIEEHIRIYQGKDADKEYESFGQALTSSMMGISSSMGAITATYTSAASGHYTSPSFYSKSEIEVMLEAIGDKSEIEQKIRSLRKSIEDETKGR